MSDLIKQAEQAKKMAYQLAILSTPAKNNALKAIAIALREDVAYLLNENKKDLESAEANGVAKPMLARLLIDEAAVEAMAIGVEQVATLPDPVGERVQSWVNEAGLRISEERVPLGVIGIIYESRPNVTVDAAALCLKTGNATILRGGKEAIHSNRALVKVIQKALQPLQLEFAVQLVQDTSRETAKELMKLNGFIDVLIPRGSAGLIQTVVKEATVPVIETGTGNCHIYIDQSADLMQAIEIVSNAKVQRPSACNAVETVLVHEEIAAEILPRLVGTLEDQGVEIRGDETVQAIKETVKEATVSDYETEFLDLILAIKVVPSTTAAIAHIAQYSTKHSEAILTNSYRDSQVFTKEVDAAVVYVNASTRFTDGFEFGFGAEIGISTQKLHARGPMGLPQLTSIKYVVNGEGQLRR
ncbi:glutamate-5-semialdehyde dehydrogenase [Brochothrix thermosphacta]|uniref:Gamma-glutamyl phosphate reductase n=1 Tax=Brochothrix thermosphacta TaxID=2756 RepID=A0A1D2LW04_BROTH|nr:glutamate-5-semialdehyde dehydrogenase [Brochothrix thermosphacta]ANZ97010.1 glutamate-5-semialdehyde dehydrogenase [Brochothrix thermosphacta]ATF26437.1 glutamate-5-semialdehyde dehydrogenase [Brochothrix thermosphacta]ATH85777.1 glutamate-5-semialdehyde dehydrogenase [Brochothrix thermosphacta]MDO7864436.1 glutamate-5-semialdehyde dehydrogenase [Brochothrix thermosphacta]MPQ29661.1 glutamate-5-semialdehyde dehydrogenase [Brochothrix thermosphacta]